MSKDIAVPTKSSLPARPSYLPEVTGESRISKIEIGGQSIPGLSLAGFKYSLVSRREVIQKWKVDELTGVLLDVHNHYQRDKYFTKYDPNDEETWGSPICFSNNAETPDPDSPEPQSETCGTCQWNSTYNKEVALDDKCGIYRNAIFLLYDPDDESRTALCRIRVNSTTCFGNQDRSSGLLNLDTLLREFAGMGSELWHHPIVLTFDEDSKHEKLHLTLLGEFIDEDTHSEIVGLQNRYGATTVEGWSSYTTRIVYDEDKNDGSSSESEAEKAPSQRAERAPKSDAGEEKAPAESEEASADEGKPSKTGNARSGRGRAARGRADKSGADGDAGKDEPADGGSEGAEESGDLSEDSDVQGLLNNMTV